MGLDNITAVKYYFYRLVGRNVVYFGGFVRMFWSYALFLF